MVGLRRSIESPRFRFSSAVCDSRAQLWETKHDEAQRSARKHSLGRVAALVSAKLNRPVAERHLPEPWQFGTDEIVPFPRLPAGPSLAQREESFSAQSCRRQVRDVLLTSWQEAYEKSVELSLHDTLEARRLAYAENAWRALAQPYHVRLEGPLREEANCLPMEGIAESNAEGTADDATLGAGMSTIQVEESLQEDLRPVPVSRLEAALPPAPVPRRAQAKGRWPLRRKTSLEEPQAPSPNPGVLGFASKEDAERSMRAWLRLEQGDREPDQGDGHAQNGVGEGDVRAVTGGGPNTRLLQPLPKQQARTSFASAVSSIESALHDEVAARDSADSAQSGSTSADLEASESLEVNSSDMELRQQTPYTDLETEEVFREIQKREQEHPPQQPHLSQIGHRQHWLDLIEHRVLQQVVVSELIAEPGGHAVRARRGGRGQVTSHPGRISATRWRSKEALSRWRL
ncbi:svop [Symbiodinium necroappetens]|uniref:Svop protein n=1 Tax=Symbiodinium necroappetens TaxID=1628268 RepID=A0A812YHV3_9DINO|nr:svop [Symbiodinium necroappetens]